MIGRWYGVVSPEWGDVIPVLDDGSGPTEYSADFRYVRATSARRAKILAVRAWRRAGSRYLRDAENPFSGVKAERISEDEPTTTALRAALKGSSQP